MKNFGGRHHQFQQPRKSWLPTRRERRTTRLTKPQGHLTTPPEPSNNSRLTTPLEPSYNSLLTTPQGTSNKSRVITMEELGKSWLATPRDNSRLTEVHVLSEWTVFEFEDDTQKLSCTLDHTWLHLTWLHLTWLRLPWLKAERVRERLEAHTERVRARFAHIELLRMKGLPDEVIMHILCYTNNTEFSGEDFLPLYLG